MAFGLGLIQRLLMVQRIVLLELHATDVVVKAEKNIPEFPMLVLHPEIGRSRAKTTNETSWSMDTKGEHRRTG